MIKWLLDLNDSDSIAFLSLIVSVATFLLGYFAYEKFLGRKAKEKQLEVVLDLIKSIHNCKNRLEIGYNGKQPTQNIRTTTGYSIFGITELPDFDIERNLYFYYPEKNELSWDFFIEYYPNPLIPKTIAQHLKKFDIRHKNKTIRKATYASDAIYIGQAIKIQDDTPIFQVTNFDGTLNTTIGFKKAATELNQSIKQWLNEYGIDDINIIDS